MRNGIGRFAVAALLAGTATGAHAQERRAEDLATDLAACRSVTTDAERLACYDRTAAALVEARAAKRIVVLDREQVREAKRSVFGFSVPTIRLFGDNDADSEVRSIDSTITGIDRAAGNLIVYRLANGSSWQATESVGGGAPRTGETIKIEAGILGAYVARVPGKRTVRVKRVR